MIRLHANNFSNLTFKGLSTPQHDNDNKNISSNEDRSYSDAITSYGKARIKPPKGEYRMFLDRWLETDNHERISLEDAVNELNVFNISDKRKTDLIMACTYETTDPEVIINKKALYTVKCDLYQGSLTPKYEDAIRTCLDEDTETFSNEKFESLFNPNGKVKISARLKARPQNYDLEYREAKAQRRLTVMEAVEKNPGQNNQKTTFNTEDFFIPLDSYKTELVEDIKKLKELPDELKENMLQSVDNSNFNLKKVYSDYYSLLDECQTLDDVKYLYPHLEYPNKPEHDINSSKRSLNNRLANENYDKIVIGILKDSHVKLKPNSNIYVPMENSAPTTIAALNNAGYNFTSPSPEIMALLNKGESIANKYKTMPKYDDKAIKDIVDKRAIRTSNVWADYAEMTSKSWLPVRLIKVKRLDANHPKYNTDRLVLTYLWNLYSTNHDAQYTPNPLEKFDDKNYLNKEMKNVINSTYITRYKNEDSDIYNDDFYEFQSKFDKKAIKKSFEHLEDRYTTAFFRSYWSPSRLASLKQSLQESYDLVFEKQILNEQLNRHTVTITNKYVEDLINNNDDNQRIQEIDDDKYSELKHTISKIKDMSLRERCMSAISDKYNDGAYFNIIYNILANSRTNESIDEDKASVLLNLHDKYLSQALSSEQELTEDEFIEQALSQYTDKNGSINFKQAKLDARAETNYYSEMDKLLNEDEYEFCSLIEDKFIAGDNHDFKTANKIIDFYNSTPKTFKNKFLSEFKNVAQSKGKITTEELDKLTKLHNKISSWNYDNDEIIIMDKNTMPQIVVITQNAKKELWEASKGNIDKFDLLLKKFFNVAQRRTGSHNGEGIKTVTDNQKYDVELKILGDNGFLRMYPRDITEEDKQKYNTGTLKVKYVFDTFGGHL